MKISKDVERAFELATRSQQHAYAPYSKFLVGAAIKLKNRDEFFGGCNVENASYGATICAERVAILSAIGKYGKCEFDFIVVKTNTIPATGPCALCLQMIAEFCPADLPIYLTNHKGVERVVKFGELLPAPFSEIPEQL